MKEMKSAIEKRRSCYSLSAQSPITNSEIKELIDCAVLHIPSAFNSQSTRTVLLLEGQHQKFWELVKDELKKVVAPAAFHTTKEKIEQSFQAGYGTVLFYEDQRIVKSLQEQFPRYRANFPVWSEHTSAMHQLAVWMLLGEVGFGASLQHYNPLIDEVVAKTWNISSEWKMIAQMPFGLPLIEPGEKSMEPLDSRSLMFD